MKGLLIKDLHLLLRRKQTLFIFVLVCLFVGFSVNGSFIIGYMAFLSTLISLSTISYDDADNGMPFLMTLPVSQKTYALSKYVLGGIICTGSWILSIAMMIGINAIKGLSPITSENASFPFVFLLMGLLMLDLMIPLQIRYGVEKSRIVMFIVFGGIAALIALLSRSNILPIAGLLTTMDRIADAWYIAGTVPVYMLLTIISANASIRIMKRKAF